MSFWTLIGGKGKMDGWVAHAYDREMTHASKAVIESWIPDVLMRTNQPTRLLDVGCGPGHFTIKLAEELPETEIQGIDLAPTMIEIARERARASSDPTNLHFEVADVINLPFPDGHFDAVVSHGSIKQWPDQVAGLIEINRVLRPGGDICLSEWNKSAPRDALLSLQKNLQNWFLRRAMLRVVSTSLSPDEVHAALAEASFENALATRVYQGGLFWGVEAQKPL